MRRARSAPAVLFCAFLPILAVAASPSPSPSASASPALSPVLDSVLLAPPSGYATFSSTQPPKNGHFTAHDWSQSYGVKSAEANRLLNEYGFVDGYNMTWDSQATRHVLNEFVLAFQGGKGAAQWLAYDKGADTSSQLYQHADTLSGIPQYFGLHESQSSVFGQAYLDGFVFVKGNDVFGVAFVSLNDDNLNLATTQAKKQYSSAPAATIPPAQWPENANAQLSPAPAAAASGGNPLPNALIIGAAAVAIILAGTLLFMRTRRAPAVAAAPVTTPARAPQPGSTVVPVTLPLQMSVDGRFWYDGERWVDVNQEAPPFARRSPDGAYWWDGYNWRPVPLAQPPVSGR